MTVNARSSHMHAIIILSTDDSILGNPFMHQAIIVRRCGGKRNICNLTLNTIFVVATIIA
jgi:hypothetical protein